MRFRTPTPADVPACMALVLRDGRCQLSPAQAQVAQQLWAEVFSDKSDTRAHGALFEDALGLGEPVLAMFTCAVFVQEAFMESLLNAPAPHCAARFYEAMLEGKSPLLSTREIALANGRRALSLLNLHAVLREPSLAHPDNASLPALGARAWEFNFSGYQMQRVLFETYGHDFSHMLRQSGFQTLRNFPENEGGKALPPDQIPHWSFIDRAHSPPAPMTIASLIFFSAPPPNFGFTSRQQRVLLLALQGETDRGMALRMDVSLATIRQAWEGIFERMPKEAMAAQPSAAHCASLTRGPERRRAVVEYVRQHMEELRPYRAPRAEQI